MAISDVHLITKCGKTPPSTVSLKVGAIAANLYLLDGRLKKAGRSELTAIFASDDQTWWSPADVLSVWENAQAFFAAGSDDSLYMLFQVAAEQLSETADVLRALPEGTVMRIEMIKSAPKKAPKSAPKTPAPSRSSSLAAAQATSALMPGAAKSSLKLDAKQRDYIQTLLERHRCDADLWTFPDIERKSRIADIDEDTGENSLERLRENVRRPQFNDEECEALVEMNLLTCEIEKRGLARRIAFNQLSDLRTSRSLEIRSRWLSHRTYRRKGASYEDAWMILRALAVKDVAVARHLLDFSDEPLSAKGHPPGKLLYNALFAIFRKDQTLQTKLVGQLAKQKAPEAYKAILNTIGGILTEDPAVISASLTQVLSTFRRIPLNDDEKVICLVAHGLAELALEKNRKLLDKFDVAQGMPWDAEFFEWLRGESSSPVYPELAKRSVILDKWLNRFEIPDAWGSVDEAK